MCGVGAGGCDVYDVCDKQLLTLDGFHLCTCSIVLKACIVLIVDTFNLIN